MRIQKSQLQSVYAEVCCMMASWCGRDLIDPFCHVGTGWRPLGYNQGKWHGYPRMNAVLMNIICSPPTSFRCLHSQHGSFMASFVTSISIPTGFLA